MEVMGLMLGEFVDDYTVRVVDVFAMPQSGTGVSVEAVDPVFQTKMMDMLRQTGRLGIWRRLSGWALTALQTRDSRWLVSLTSWIRLLAFLRRHQYAAVFRTADTTSGGRGGGSDTVSKRQGRNRCFPVNKSSNLDDGT